MSAQKIDKVVICGRDAAAWLAANALSRAFSRSGLTVEVVELPSLLRSHDILSSLPPLEAFHRLLGFDEYALMKATSATFSLGQSFVNFARSAPPFFHGYGGHGAPIAGQPFMPFWIKARQAGMNVALEDFSLTAAAAKQGRFFLPTEAYSVFGRTDYAYHLKAKPYVQLLKTQALRRGVTVHAARFATARLDDTGAIRAVVLPDGSEVAGDLFIDASDAESTLLGDALGVPFDSWQAWFPGNRVLTVAGERLRSLPPYGQVRALSNSVLHLAPVQDQTGVQHVFNDATSTDQEALEAAALISNLRLAPDAVVSPLAVGRRASVWVKNCIALGEAACVLDPIDNAGLHTIQLGLAHLINLFPLDRHVETEAYEYNTQMGNAFDRIRDYQIAHYKLNRIENQPMWDALRDMTVPETLAYKIDLFKARGTVAIYEEETFETDDWLALFTGHGLIPRSYDPAIDLVPTEQAVPQFQRMLGYIKAQVQDMNSHDAFLEMHASKDFA